MQCFFFLIGNIRVYCRIRPFLSGQNRKQTTIEYIGENGELVVVNPLKQGKDSRRLFKFNKVFGPTASQGSCHLLFMNRLMLRANYLCNYCFWPQVPISVLDVFYLF